MSPRKIGGYTLSKSAQLDFCKAPPDPVKTIDYALKNVISLQKERASMGAKIIKYHIEKSRRGRFDKTAPKALNRNIATEMEKSLVREFKIINASRMSGKKAARDSFVPTENIETLSEFLAIKSWMTLRSEEIAMITDLDRMVVGIPVWDEYLQFIKGIGGVSAAVLICCFDIKKAKYPSSMWKYAGLDVASDGRGRTRKHDHLERIDFVDASGKSRTRIGLTYNPWLKSRLMGVVAQRLMSFNQDYKKIYDDYRNRLKNRQDLKGAPNGRLHNMAMRYMVKRFLVDLYKNWREIEGLEVHPEYSEAKLGISHGN